MSLAPGRLDAPSDATANLQSARPNIAREMAKQAHISERTLFMASLVYRRCVPEVQALVEHGELAVSSAARLARYDAGTQRAIIAEAPRFKNGRRLKINGLLDVIEFQREHTAEFDRLMAEAGSVGPA